MLKADLTERRIEYMPLDELLAWPANSKDHDVGLLNTAMRRFGFIDPIVLCERVGRIAAGHGRQKTLHGMMIARDIPPDGIRVREDGMWLVPVVRGWHSKDDRELDAATVALNQATIAGGWDESKLKDVLVAIGAGTEHGLDGIGFDVSDVEDLIANLDKQQGSAMTPTLPTSPWVHTGDLFGLGDHRLLVGNALARADHQALCRGEHLDVVLACPMQATDDPRVYKTTIGTLLDVWSPRLTYLFVPWKRWSLLTEALSASGFDLRAQLIWDTEAMGGGRGWLDQHELIACAVRGKVSFPATPARGDVLRYRRVEPKHALEKPFELIKEILHTTSPAIARTIGDPFALTGTTLIACEALGRVCYSMEASPALAQVCVERWQTFTGKTAEKLEEGERAPAQVRHARPHATARKGKR